MIIIPTALNLFNFFKRGATGYPMRAIATSIFRSLHPNVSQGERERMLGRPTLVQIEKGFQADTVSDNPNGRGRELLS